MSLHKMPKEKREAIGISDGLIRLYIGLENVEDIIEDLAQALDKVKILIASI